LSARRCGSTRRLAVLRAAGNERRHDERGDDERRQHERRHYWRCDHRIGDAGRRHDRRVDDPDRCYSGCRNAGGRTSSSTQAAATTGAATSQAAATTGGTTTGSSPPARRASFRRKTLRAAKLAIRQRRCVTGRVTKRASTRRNKGRVISQSPRSGRTAARLGRESRRRPLAQSHRCDVEPAKRPAGHPDQQPPVAEA